MTRLTGFPISNLQPRISSCLLAIGHWSLVILRCSLFIVHCSLLIALTACARSDDTWDRVRDSGVLRVGMDASFPPFESIAADGTLVGFDVDLARELGRRLGVEVQFVANLPYDGLYDALAVGRVDVVISALVIDPTRMADFAYSASYFDAGQVLVVPDEPGAFSATCQVSEPVEGIHLELVEGMADLGGCTLAVEFGTQGDLEARKWARRLPDLTLVPCETAAEALAAVTAGEADAVLVDHVSALAAIQLLEISETPKGFGLLIVEEPVVPEPYAIAVHEGSQALLRAIDDALAEMAQDGTLDGLATDWLR
jgi:ABC-type amino acid transport substrate-binding protein